MTKDYIFTEILFVSPSCGFNYTRMTDCVWTNPRTTIKGPYLFVNKKEYENKKQKTTVVAKSPKNVKTFLPT